MLHNLLISSSLVRHGAPAHTPGVSPASIGVASEWRANIRLARMTKVNAKPTHYPFRNLNAKVTFQLGPRLGGGEEVNGHTIRFPMVESQEHALPRCKFRVFAHAVTECQVFRRAAHWRGRVFLSSLAGPCPTHAIPFPHSISRRINKLPSVVIRQRYAFSTARQKQ